MKGNAAAAAHEAECLFKRCKIDVVGGNPVFQLITGCDNGADALGDEENAAVCAKVHIPHLALCLLPGRQEGLLHFISAAADIGWETAKVQREVIKSRSACQFRAVIQKRLIGCIADARNENGEFFHRLVFLS